MLKKNLWFVYSFWHFGYIMLCQTINKNAFNIHRKITVKSTLQFGAILDPTWPHFGCILGPRSGQVGPKSLPKSISKSIQKIITFQVALDTDFGRFGAPTWPPRGGPRNHFSKSFWLLKLSWGQDGPKTPPRAPRNRFWTNFD